MNLAVQRRGDLLEHGFDGPTLTIQLGQRQSVGVTLGHVAEQVDFPVTRTRRLVQLHRNASEGGRLTRLRVTQLDGLLIDHSRWAMSDLPPPTQQRSLDGAVLPDQEVPQPPGDTEEELQRAEVPIGQPQILGLDTGQRGVQQTAFLGVTILGQEYFFCQHPFLIQHDQDLARQRRRPRGAQLFNPMLGGRQMVAIQNPTAIARQPRLQTGVQAVDGRGRLPGRVPDQCRRHRRLDAIQLVVDRRQRNRGVVLFQSLEGRVDAGLYSQNHIAHQADQGRKMQLLGVTRFGALAEKGVDPRRIEQPFENPAGHHTHRPLFHKRLEYLSQKHKCRLPADSPESHPGGRLPNTCSCWKGCPCGVNHCFAAIVPRVRCATLG